MTALKAADLVVPLRDCTPWCEVGDRHSEDHPEDRSCWSEYQVIPLSQHQAVKMNDGLWWQDFINVYLRRHPKAESPLIYLHNENTDEEIKLTLDEARDLMKLLSDAVDAAGPSDAERRERNAFDLGVDAGAYGLAAPTVPVTEGRDR